MTARETSPDAVVQGGAELIEFRTTLTTGEVTRSFRERLEQTAKRVEYSRLDPRSNPFDEYEDSATFSALCAHDGAINGWAVQLHVFDHGDFRDGRIVVLGSTGIGRMFAGAATYSRAAGRAGATLVMEALRAQDPALSLRPGLSLG